MRKVLKEVALFISIFVILALGMHMDEWLNAPIEHIKHLSKHTMPWHPLIYTGFFYAFLAVIRVVAAGIKNLFKSS